MKKILFTAIGTTILLTSQISYANYQKSSHNWNGAKKVVAVKEVVKSNTLVAHRYNRDNSVSSADIAKIATKVKKAKTKARAKVKKTRRVKKVSSAYSKALAKAKVEQKKASKVGFEWNTIKKLLKAAGKDHKAGNDKSAIKKLNTASVHAKLGQQQARDQKNAGPRF